jgi:hypothetical protein
MRFFVVCCLHAAQIHKQQTTNNLQPT